MGTLFIVAPYSIGWQYLDLFSYSHIKGCWGCSQSFDLKKRTRSRIQWITCTSIVSFMWSLWVREHVSPRCCQSSLCEEFWGSQDHPEQIFAFSNDASTKLSPPSPRWPIPRTPAPQAQPNQHGGGGAEGGAPARPQGKLQCCGEREPRAAPLQPHGQQRPQPQQGRDPRAAEGQHEHPCELGGAGGMAPGLPPPVSATWVTFPARRHFPSLLFRTGFCYIHSVIHSTHMSACSAWACTQF